MIKYSMKNLRQTFLDHAAKSEISNQHQKQMWMEMNPGESVPEHFNDEFSLPEALASMCEAIISLQS